MTVIKDLLKCAVLLTCASFFFALMRLAQDADAAVQAIPSQFEITRAQLLSTEREQFDKLNAQLTAARVDLSQKVLQVSDKADHRLEAIQAVVDKRLGEATFQIEAIRAGLNPILTNAAALEKDAQDSLDDLYPDIKASTESATVAITSIAQTSEAVRDAAPQIADSVISIGKSAASTSADIKREADYVTRPKHWYERILGPIYVVGRLVAAFL